MDHRLNSERVAWRTRLALPLATMFIVGACGGTAGTQAPATSGASTSSGASASSSASASAATAKAAAGGSITADGGTGQWAECLRSVYYDPFEKETGINVISGPESNGAVIAKTAQETGVYTLDVGFAGSQDIIKSSGALFEPLDYTQIKRDEIINGLALDYGIGFDPYVRVLGYNTKFTGGKVPTSIADFFDLQKFPGKRGLDKASYSTAAAMALMADGVAPDEVFPIDWDRAYKKLDTIKDQIVLSESGTNARELLDSGETPLSYIYANRLKESNDAGKTEVGVVWDAITAGSDFAVIPKGDPHKDAAQQLAAYMVRKDVNGNLSACIALSPANKLSPLPDNNKAWLYAAHLDAPNVVMDDPEHVKWLAQTVDEDVARWQSWLAQ